MSELLCPSKFSEDARKVKDVFIYRIRTFQCYMATVMNRFFIADGVCEGGRLKSPCIIDANDIVHVSSNDSEFLVNDITSEVQKLQFNFHYSQGQLYITEFTETHRIPHVKVQGTVYRLDKIWFRYYFALRGSEHQYMNNEAIEGNIDEKYMEFRQCTLADRSKHIIFVSVLKRSSGAKNEDYRDYSDIFVDRIPIGSKRSDKKLDGILSWDSFISRDRTNAFAYNGSLPDGTCKEPVLYVIFLKPIFADLGEEFNNYYGNTVQMARPVQGTPDVVYKYSSHHFDFDYVLSNQESELCQASAEKKKASTTSMSLNEEKSTDVESQEDRRGEEVGIDLWLFPPLQQAICSSLWQCIFFPDAVSDKCSNGKQCPQWQHWQTFIVIVLREGIFGSTVTSKERSAPKASVRQSAEELLLVGRYTLAKYYCIFRCTSQTYVSDVRGFRFRPTVERD
ncbi:unnamed protein product [Toxocara canis]|uniref:Alpha-carbonic anhydrase domain-containing protein n=1 Tax=Toxocara canis TaxID=6265 RepID=A0A183V9B7_TOXCA|nr:unnamed protein product [Toxocara canis]